MANSLDSLAILLLFGYRKYRLIPSQSLRPIFQQSTSAKLGPTAGPQKEASRVKIQCIFNSLKRVTRAVPSLSFWTLKEQSWQLKTLCILLMRQGKALALLQSSSSLLPGQHPQKKTFLFLECPWRSMYILSFLVLFQRMIISLSIYISGWYCPLGCFHLRLRSAPAAEKRQFPLATPSTFIIGTTLKRKRSRRKQACSESEISYLRKPSTIKDEPVQPGCTRPDIITSSLLLGFPKVSNGIVRPSQLRPRECALTLGCNWAINWLSLLSSQGKEQANSTQEYSLALKKYANFKQKYRSPSSTSYGSYRILSPPRFHLFAYLLSRQQIFIPQLYRLLFFVNPLIVKSASPFSPSTEKQNHVLVRDEFVYCQSSIRQELTPISSTEPREPESKLDRKVAVPIFIIFPCGTGEALAEGAYRGQVEIGEMSSPNFCFQERYLVRGCEDFGGFGVVRVV